MATRMQLHTWGLRLVVEWAKKNFPPSNSSFRYRIALVEKNNHNYIALYIKWHHMTLYAIISQYITSHDLTWPHMTSHDITSHGHHMTSHDLTWAHMSSHNLTWAHKISYAITQVAVQTCSLSRCMPGGPCCTLLSSHSEYSCLSVLDGWGLCDLFVELWVCECEGVRVWGCEGLHSDDVGTLIWQCSMFRSAGRLV